MPTTLIGQVERVTFENETTSFRVLRVGSLENVPFPGPIAVVGTLPAVGPGTRVRLTGDFVRDARHGDQFRADTLVPLEPSSLPGLEKYLGSGVIPGVGPGIAKRIVKRFGMESLKVLDTEPDRLREIPGIGARRVDEIKRTWSDKRELSNVMVLLSSHGASPALAARIVRRYGDRAASVVQRSPYRLALEVHGVGFKTADRLARSLGISGDHPERAQAGVIHELGLFADQGHVAVPRSHLVEQTAAMLEVDAAHVESAIDALRAAERVVVEDELVFSARLHAAETAVAAHLARLLDAPGEELLGLEASIRDFERRTNIELAPAQRHAVEAAARHKVLVVTGGPGVGKTTIVRAILGVLGKSKLDVRLAAPTGRAARRMADATNHPATTIHRLLEFDPRSGAFQRNRERPVDTDALIVDEASMIDISLAAALLDATPSAARLVIVGDADQLPSVGPGALLRDLLECGVVPVVRLTEIFRQAQTSRIVRNAHRILQGAMPESAAADEEADFFVVERRDPTEAAQVVCELATRRIPRRFGFDPKTEVQVLTPMHRGPAGTIALNERLQALLNPGADGLVLKSGKVRAGDKVMQLRNDYDRDVYNGDTGIVTRVSASDRALNARFDGRDVEYDETALESLALAYATSIHKSQGSEYPAVVIPILTSHFVMLTQNLIYTAVTRAKKLCVLVADPRALRLALSEMRREDRNTLLAARLRQWKNGGRAADFR